jgi:hypothetical protein
LFDIVQPWMDKTRSILRVYPFDCSTLGWLRIRNISPTTGTFLLSKL